MKTKWLDEFNQGRYYGAIGVFWEEFQEQHDRQPTWNEIEDIIAKCLNKLSDLARMYGKNYPHAANCRWATSTNCDCGYYSRERVKDALESKMRTFIDKLSEDGDT